ncbi:hypothetical protein WN51_09572 [Melipona quadrifasciata]|uniref:Uncharacterized protein n=1 Tax=Melipona quadrifasciata TaxID=166423 RepID=A0A0M9A8P5_9HYME|nr:hypothetical protein WN51_09572 [Melipona quadrifasciata]
MTINKKLQRAQVQKLSELLLPETFASSSAKIIKSGRAPGQGKMLKRDPQRLRKASKQDLRRPDTPKHPMHFLVLQQRHEISDLLTYDCPNCLAIDDFHKCGIILVTILKVNSTEIPLFPSFKNFQLPQQRSVLIKITVNSPKAAEDLTKAKLEIYSVNDMVLSLRKLQARTRSDVLQTPREIQSRDRADAETERVSFYGNDSVTCENNTLENVLNKTKTETQVPLNCKFSNAENVRKLLIWQANIKANVHILKTEFDNANKLEAADRETILKVGPLHFFTIDSTEILLRYIWKKKRGLEGRSNSLIFLHAVSPQLKNKIPPCSPSPSTRPKSDPTQVFFAKPQTSIEKFFPLLKMT